MGSSLKSGTRGDSTMTLSMKLPATVTPLSRDARVTVVLLFIVWLVDYFDRLIMNFALPYIGKDFQLNHTQQGLLVSAFFITYAFSQLPGGVLADRIGTRKTIAIAMIGWSAFTGLTGLAWSFSALIVIRFLFGIGEGVLPGASYKAISERTEPGDRMTAIGIMSSSNQFGAAVAPNWLELLIIPIAVILSPGSVRSEIALYEAPGNSTSPIPHRNRITIRPEH